MKSSISETYESIRRKNKEIQTIRKTSIYNSLPDIMKIDKKLRENGVNLAMIAFEKDIDHNEHIDNLKLENKNLLDEKKAILIKNGYTKDFLDDIYDCKACKDTGFVNGKYCSCYVNKKIEQNYMNSGLGEKIKTDNFDNFNFDLYKNIKHPTDENIDLYKYMKNVVKLSKDYVLSIKQRDDDIANGIIFYGSTGVGKTYLLSSICKFAIDNAIHAEYLTMSDWLVIASDCVFSKVKNQETLNLYNDIKNAELLLIDDLGVEMTNNFVNSEFFDLINTRLNRKKNTIISTNLNLSSMSDQYDQRIVSRFYTYQMIEIIGEDIRQL